MTVNTQANDMKTSIVFSDYLILAIGQHFINRDARRWDESRKKVNKR